MHADFDLCALASALDARRKARGLSWSTLGAELGISAATLRGLGSRSVAEGDGVLRVAAWLGRSLESFVPGHPGDPDRAPLPARARALRFDTRALYVALDGERAARGLSWREVAATSGVPSASALTRLRRGGRIMFPVAMRIFLWIGTPASRFVRVVAP